jgi:hypothetical protein
MENVSTDNNQMLREAMEQNTLQAVNQNIEKLKE